MNYLKKFLIFMVFLLPLVFMTLNVSASTFYDDIKTEVENYVTKGDLPAWHNNLSGSTGYQTIYTKFVRTGNDLEHFKTIPEEQMRTIINWYLTHVDTVWEDILNNLDIEPQYLEQNKILGLYWDSKIEEESSYLYLIWTSKYLPSEFMNIKEINVNNKTYKLYDSEKDKQELNANWWISDYYHYSYYDFTIHKTPIGGYENGKTFGIPLTQKYNIKSFKAGIDEAEYLNNPDPQGLYNVTCNTAIEFDLGKIPTKDGVKLCQLVTHAYEIIKDCEVQSYFDLGFGGYIHNAVFNTTIEIDRIYRVDVAYTLSSENKDWYQIWLNTKERDVKKSLTAERKAGGFFNLFAYQGFKEGTFKSNNKASKTYKYRLHLNYDESCWNIFDSKPYYEADYKVIKNFKILRMNYLVDDQVYDVAVKMDTIDGKTLSIVNKDLILDTDSATWKVKDKVYGAIDDIKDKLGQTGTILVTIGAVAIGIILLYVVVKIIKLFSLIFKGGKNS